MNKRLLAAMAAGGLVLSGPLMAAEDGELAVGAGAESQGSLEVMLQIPDMIRVSGFENVDLEFDDNTENFTGSNDLCVFRNITGEYAVTASSTNGDGAFELSDGDASTVPYSVEWAGQGLDEDTALTGLDDADTSSPNCNGGTNVVMDLLATGDDVAAADTTDDHTDTLTVMVQAE